MDDEEEMTFERAKREYFVTAGKPAVEHVVVAIDDGELRRETTQATVKAVSAVRDQPPTKSSKWTLAIAQSIKRVRERRRLAG